MRIPFLILLVLALPAAARAGDGNAIKNGDFEKGKMAWKTEPGVHVIDVPAEGAAPAGKVLEFELDKKDRQVASTRLDIKTKTKALALSFRVKPGADFKSATPDGQQITIRVERPDKSYLMWERKIKPDGQWQDIKFDFSDFKGSTTFTFSWEIHPGEGKVWIDDVVANEM